MNVIPVASEPPGLLLCHSVRHVLESSLARVWIRALWLCSHGPGEVQAWEAGSLSLDLQAGGPWWITQPLCAFGFLSVKGAVSGPYLRNVSVLYPCETDCWLLGQGSSVNSGATVMLLKPMPVYPDLCIDDSTSFTSRFIGWGTSSKCKGLKSTFQGHLFLDPPTVTLGLASLTSWYS